MRFGNWKDGTTTEENPTPYAWIDDVAEMSRSKHGRIRVHSTWAQDDSEVGAGAGFGAVTGGVIGASTLR